MRAVFFDAHGILYDRPREHAHMAAFLHAHALPLPDPAALWAATRPEHARASLEEIPQRELYVAILRAHGVTEPNLQEEGLAALDADSADITLFDNVPQTLANLGARGYALGVITNSSTPSLEKLRWFRGRGLDVPWAAFVNSCEVGLRKPDVRIYALALERCGVQPAEAAFIGHSSSELRGAHGAGITTIAVGAEGTEDADIAVGHLADLLDLDQFR